MRTKIILVRNWQTHDHVDEEKMEQVPREYLNNFIYQLCAPDSHVPHISATGSP